MSYEVKILKDSVNEEGDRLVTMEATLPRIILAELNTHRVFSRNSASSRAIPVEKMLKRVEETPFVPIYWGKNQKGMQANVELSQDEQRSSEYVWLKARDNAVKSARELLEIGVHKQITNRLLEPFLWHTVIISATEWENFFALRTHKDAQPEICKVAQMMNDVYELSEPVKFVEDYHRPSWHRPLILSDEMPKFKNNIVSNEEYQRYTDHWNKISAGRCARVSYLTHDGKRDQLEDINLCNRLIESGHMSPLEHVARPMTRYDIEQMGINASTRFLGNFRGWVQLRKLIANEDNYAKNLLAR